MIQNPHSIITDEGVISIVRQAKNLSQEIKRGFEQREQRVARMKKLEGRRRRQVLKDSVRAIQLASSSTRSRFVAELETYEPPLESVLEEGAPEAEENVAIRDLLDRMSHEESETMKSIIANLRDGMPVQKLLRIARDAKQSHEVEAQHMRVEQLLGALDLSHTTEALQKNIHGILHETYQLPLPRNPKPIRTLQDTSSSESSSVSDDESVSDDTDNVTSDRAVPIRKGTSTPSAQAILDFVCRGPPRRQRPSSSVH
jgi:hypothetical protein